MPNINKELIDSVFERYNRVCGYFRHLMRSQPIRALDQLIKKEMAFVNDQLMDRKSLIEIFLTVHRDDSATWYAFKPLRKQFTRYQHICFFKIHRAGLLSQTDIEPIWESRSFATFLRNTLRDFGRAKVLNVYTLSHLIKLVKTSAGRKIIKAAHYLFQSNLLKDGNIKKLFEHGTVYRNIYEYLSFVYKENISSNIYAISIKRGLEHLRNAGILDQSLYDIFLKYPPFSDFTDALDILLCHNILSHDIALELYEHHLSYAFYDESRNHNTDWIAWSPNPHSRTPQNVALGLTCIASSPLTLGLTKENRALWYSVISSGFNDEILEAMEIFHSSNILTQPLLEKVIKMHYNYLPTDTDFYYDTHCYTKKRKRIFTHAENFKYTVNCLSRLYEKDDLNLERAYELLENCEHPDTIDEIMQGYPSLSKETNINETCSIPLPLSDEVRFHPFNKNKKEGLTEFCKDVPRMRSERLSLSIKGHPIPLEEVKKLEEKFTENNDTISPENIQNDPSCKFLTDELTKTGTGQLFDGFHQSLMSAPTMILTPHIKTKLNVPLQSESISTNFDLSHETCALEVKTIAKKFHVFTEEKGDITLEDAKIGNPQVLVEFHPDEKSKGFILNAKTDDIALSKGILNSFCNMRLEQNIKLRSDKKKSIFAFFRKDSYAIEDFYIAAYQDFMHNFPENETLIFVLKKFTNIDLFIGFMYIRREVNTILQYVGILLENKKFTITEDFRRIIQYYRSLKHTFDDDLKSEQSHYLEIPINDLLQYQKNIDKDILYLESIKESRDIVQSIYNYLYT